MAGCRKAVENESHFVDVGLKECFFPIKLYAVYHGMIFGNTDNFGLARPAKSYKKDMVPFDAS